ncbi:excisionase family DNA-binding protein [Sphingosinicella microcystinivorans]|uniref:excisionase family DNA-binding protein n=1 Tax=Sphingosinicella microcystinivorans TaxID=335406 RepID=UPI0022F39322|nr:excisionase family DNA-binding protein [Sphingosinicella microcystinivorans]WBX85608.1 excisionase family DNA-binding protein [Sphingosinicella microcystinivorans]
MTKIRIKPGHKPPSPNMPQALSAPGKPRPGKAFHTVADLAERWTMSQRNIRRLIENGELSVHRFGRSVRVSAANVALFEARCADVI